MKRVVVLGSTGMLGQQVSKTAAESGLVVLPISRSTKVSFNFPQDKIRDLSESLNLGPQDWLVNCTGWIPQKASPSQDRNARAAISLNSSLPAEISEARKDFGFNWVQIATDCVFSGSKGCYNEGDVKDAGDLYGLSKIAGEEKSDGAIQVRCSIVGPDEKSHAGLFSWFQSESKLRPVPGFIDHRWNGVTTKAFSRLVAGMVESDFVETGSWHWIPKDNVSKFELLTLFARKLGLPGSAVFEEHSERPLNRTLSTLHESQSILFWHLAGYAQVPTVAEMVEDMDISLAGMIS